MSDPYPVIDEFGSGSCTCNGTMTGCAVCSAAAILVRYGKKIPRLTDGTPDMRTLGKRMGARCRAFDDCDHGRSLYGICGPGNYWCGQCIRLELLANGIPATYGRLTWAGIVSLLRAKKPVALSGMYSELPIVSPTSYSRSIPARGRSDRTFGGPHMMVAWGVASWNAAHEPTSFYVSDPDFGSPARPVVPPHSVIAATALKAYWAALAWPVAYVTVAPPSLATPSPAPAPTPSPAPRPSEDEMGLRFRFVKNVKGTVTVKTDAQHYLVRVGDEGQVKVAGGQKRVAYAQVELLEPLDKNPGNRVDGWLVGEIPGDPNIEAAFLLAVDVTPSVTAV